MFAFEAWSPRSAAQGRRTLRPSSEFPHRRAAGRRHRAFTLVELLVVIAILALLVAIVSPSFRRVVELGRIAVCGSNLHQYGVGIHNYRAESNLRIMKIVHQWGGPRPYPDYIRFDNTAKPEWAGEWAVKQIRPYIKSFEMESEYVGGIAVCPSVDVNLMNRFIRERNFHALRSCQFIEFPYVYWGGIDHVNAAYIRNGADEELADSLLRRPGLLMSDILYFDASDWPKPWLGAWRYNHGPRGWAFNEETYLPQDFGDVPNPSGTNQLFGDGSVRWKARGQFEHLYLMQTPAAYPDGFIGHSSQDSFYY